MDLFTSIALFLRNLLGPGGLGLAEWFVDLIMALLRAALIGTFALLIFMFLTWLERKVVARMQDRLGPTYAGPIGLLQPIADGIKTLTKEIIVPAGTDRWIYAMAPILAASAAMCMYAVIPMGPDTGYGALVGTSLNVGALYILAIGAISVVAVLMAGWGSNNKFALLGAFRAVAQLISYEVPQVLGIIVLVMLAGTMDLVQIVNAQHVPFLLPLFVTALVFLISGVAESGRSPFDLLEAESEIVAGYHVEYSAMMFAMFQLGEYVHAFAISAIFTTVFLNGWYGPILPPFIWFLIKSMGVFFVMMWFRGTLPRFRIDQMMAFNWKFLVPLSLVNIVVIAIADKVLRDAAGWSSTTNAWAWGLAMFAVNIVVLLVSLAILSRAGRRSRQRVLAEAHRREMLPATGR